MEIFHDNFQNYKRYNIPKAQLVIADIPYNLGINAYASNPAWFKNGDNKQGESDKAGKTFFDTDKNFNIHEFMHFCSKMLKKEPKERNKAPAMIVFCSFLQQYPLIKLAEKYGFKGFINLVFRKQTSAEVLKANMRIVGNCEYALVFYRDKLPKFRNNGNMILNCMDFIRDDMDIPRIHPTQKPIKVLENLIRIFTDDGDVVIDPCCGSGSTLVAAENLGRKSYGFEIKKEFVNLAKTKMFSQVQKKLF